MGSAGAVLGWLHHLRRSRGDTDIETSDRDLRSVSEPESEPQRMEKVEEVSRSKRERTCQDEAGRFSGTSRGRCTNGVFDRVHFAIAPASVQVSTMTKTWVFLGEAKAHHDRQVLARYPSLGR